MTLSDDTITEFFCQVDTFCIHFHKALAPHISGYPPKKKPKLSVSEVITLMILFHHSGYRTRKGFYPDYVKVHVCHLFPNTVSYHRFVELMAAANLPLKDPAFIKAFTGKLLIKPAGWPGSLLVLSQKTCHKV